jgi:hypothetical protein
MQLSALESVEVVDRSPPQTALLPDGLYLDFVALFLPDQARWRLAWQLQFQLRDEQFGVERRLCVTRQNQPALIDRRNPHVNHFDFGQLFQHRRRRQPRGVQQKTLLQGYLQAVGEKGDQNVRVGAMLQLMADRAYAEFTFERSKYRFDLGQLHVTRPQHAGISGGKVGPQQVSVRHAMRPLGVFSYPHET